MNVEDFEKAYYGKNYKVMNKTKKDHEVLKADFLKKYPYTDISKFEFNMYYNQDGTLESTAIYFKNSDVISTDIKSSTFFNDKSMTKYLYSNKGNDNKHLDSLDGTSMSEHGDDTSMNKHFNPKVKHSDFPKIWRLDRTVQVLPKGRRRGFLWKRVLLG